MSVTATTTLVHVPDHGDRAVDALLSVNKCKPRISALARAQGNGAQLLEDPVFGFVVGWSVDTVSGSALDVFGRIVGEQRQGLGDSAYRRFIQARIKANVSDGSRNELTEIYALLMDANDVRYFDLPPAAFAIQAQRADWLDDVTAARVVAFMRDVKPAGVGMSLVESINQAFTYEDGPGYDSGLYSRYL